VSVGRFRAGSTPVIVGAAGHRQTVTPAYCAAHNWLIGAPDTVAAKLRRAYDEVGGFGTLLLFGFDSSDEPAAWHTSMRLLAEEVMPQVADLTPHEAVALS
jgi:alkanesulfonate monooxygenase SsuD/methylene tetrahydromethanopterin reductase-like flavin-dependent oxidoreductase (luciferase family)